MQKKGKLELTWVGKYEGKEIEPRILVEDKSKSYGDPNSENMLIHGDNLIALKALEQDYAGRIKCIYIDPPYNTGSRIDADGKDVTYDDGLEHSEWLNMMYPRLKLLYTLLHEEGSLIIQIDDREYARLYLILIEIFGEENLKTICVKMSEPTGVKMAHVINSGRIPKLKEYLIVARKNGIRDLWIDKIPKGKWDNEYKTFIENLTQEEVLLLKEIRDNEDRTEADIATCDNILSKIKFTSLTEIYKKNKITTDVDKEKFNLENAWRIVQIASMSGGVRNLVDSKSLTNDNVSFCVVTPQKKMYIIKNHYDHTQNIPRIKLLFADDYLTVHPGDFWQDIKTTGLDNEGGVAFKKGKKPETLIKRIISMATSEGDIVLDSFLGSGTTAAVAHKMGRKWIGIELGNHAYTHCKVRLDKVIDGEQGGISKAVNWQGGGGYHFYELAPSLLVPNKKLPSIKQVNPEYTFEMMCEAICKLEGFKYKPDGKFHGKSSEQRFIHITKEFVNGEYINNLLANLSEGQSLLVYGTKIQSGLRLPDNIIVKKIPKDLLDKCTFESEVR